jgi:hypothetical protein
LPGSWSHETHGAGLDARDGAVPAQQLDPGATAVFDNQACREGVVAHLQRSRPRDARPERAGNLAAGGIPRVQYTADRVGTFASQRRCAVNAAIECDAPVQQFGDVARPFGDEHVNGLGIAEPGARIERVGQVQCRRVVASHRGGNATLCVAGVALGAAGLREEQHVSASDQIGRRSKAGDPSADDHVVGAYVHPVLS